MRDGTINTEILLKTLSKVYEAALDASLWQGTVNDIADLIGAESTHLMAVDTATGADPLGFITRQDPAAHREYMEDFLPLDTRLPRLAATRPGRIVRNRDVWTDEERLSSPLYQDYQRVHRLFEITGSQLGIESHLTWIGFSRNEQLPFEGDDLRVIEMLVPHFRQALRIALELRSAVSRTEMLGDLWTADGRGIVILGADGKIGFVNAEAEAMCRAGIVRLSANRASFPDSEVNTMLAANLAALQQGRPAPMAAGLVTLPDGEQTGIRFMPLTAGIQLTQDSASLLIVLVPLNRAQGPTEAEIAQFGGLFGLTPTEQRVLLATSSGIELTAQARERGVSVDTVRQQMKSTLAKTGCRSQKDLLRLIERFCFFQLR